MRKVFVFLAAVVLALAIAAPVVAASNAPLGSMTGGGQITTGAGPADLRISFGGNIIRRADYSLTGQWETQFHNVGVDSLGGASFHSNSISALVSLNDGGAGPNPPAGVANVVWFRAAGQLNGVDGWTFEVWLTDRGEPGSSDAIRFILTDPAGTVQYDSATDFTPADFGETALLSAGNLQVRMSGSGG